MGGLRGLKRAPPARSVPRSALHFQRRYPGNRGRHHGNHTGGREGDGHPAETTEDRHFRIRLGRIGIANLILTAMREDGLGDAEARRRFYAVDRFGLIVEGGKEIRAEQEPYARKRADLEGWEFADAANIGLFDVVRNAHPTVLAGVSAQPGSFTEDIVREMARHTPRPVIFPLSNPTSCAEATPENLLRWTKGAALVGTGSPFNPVEIDGRIIPITQTNNSYIFPGLALGILVSKAERVSDGMIMASAKALAGLTHQPRKATQRMPSPACFPRWRIRER